MSLASEGLGSAFTTEFGIPSSQIRYAVAFGTVVHVKVTVARPFDDP